MVPRTMRGETLVTISRSSPKVLVTAKPQPASKERRIIAAEVHGVALASPKGLGNVMPAMSTEMSEDIKEIIYILKESA